MVKKIRIVFLDISQARAIKTAVPYLEGNFYGSESFSILYFNRYDNYSQRTGLTGVIAHVPVATKTLTLNANSITQLSPSGSLECKEGAQLEYAGRTFKINSIVKSTMPMQLVERQTTCPWAILVSEVGGSMWNREVNWSAFDPNGLRINVIDRQGSPVYIDQFKTSSVVNKALEKAIMENNLPEYAEATFRADYQRTGSGDMIISTNINPEKISYIKASTTTASKVTITGIPLDPPR